MRTANRIAIAQTVATLSKRQAISEVRAIADSLIDQATRKARGFDQGAYRDDDTMRHETIRETVRTSVACAFALSAAHA